MQPTAARRTPVTDRRRPIHEHEHVVDELLGRGRRPTYGEEARELIAGSRVAITGAGGSVGGELVAQVAGLSPSAIWMLDHDESSLQAVQLKVYGEGQLAHERTVLADIRDFSRMQRLLESLQPDLVFHAAAHKHLAMLERYPSEAVRTNVFGTLATIAAAKRAGVQRFILVSTDKAANPSSVLGVTKRLAEVVTRRLGGPAMARASVRFGNVLGSRGSFLHTLEHQLRNGLPVTVTDPEADRYFMTIPEAAGLVIESAVLAGHGETYLLDMGEPVRIVDLVTRYARVRQLPEPVIHFTGLLPGEKRSEQLLDDSESMRNTVHEQIYRVRVDEQETPIDLEPLADVVAAGDESEVAAELSRLGFHLGGWANRKREELIPA
jgi:FlaA1/EpsC-like NDP-sugar epimerase